LKQKDLRRENKRIGVAVGDMEEKSGKYEQDILPVIHDDISLMQFVIPGLTKPAPYLIRGNPVTFWIPAGVYPILDTGRE
jgi:hypothetical protein